MSRDYIIREYMEGDEDSIVELLGLVFGRWPNFDIGCTPLEHWSWKYQDNPIGESIISVAEFEGELVGVNHALPVRMKVGGESMISCYVSDTVVHPDHQGRGVFSRLATLKDSLRLEAGERFGYLVTSNPILIRSFDEKQSHRRLPRDVVNLVRIRDIDEQLAQMKVKHPLLVKYGLLILMPLSRAWHSLRWSGGEEDDIWIKKVSRFTEEIEGFMEELEGFHDLMVKRDCLYLNWRYIDRRAGGYTVKTAENHEGLQGYVVYKINRARPDYPIGYIVDLLTLPGMGEAAEALIANSLQHMEEAGVNLTNLLTTKGSPAMKPALRQGLIDSRVDIHAYIRTIQPTPELDQLYNSQARVHFCYGDIDTLPSQIPESISL